MKVVVALAATASALVAPVAKVAPATVVDAKSAAMPFLECPAALDGLDYPGNVGFDPLRFTDSDWNMAEVIIPKERWMGEYAEIPMVYWMREAELKHGRICMLAVVGWLTVDAGIHFPGEKYAGIDALHDGCRVPRALPHARRCAVRILHMHLVKSTEASRDDHSAHRAMSTDMPRDA